MTVWCKFYDEAHLESPQADEAMYGMAMFNLKRTSPALIQWILTPRRFKIHVCCQFVVNSLSDETIVSAVCGGNEFGEANAGSMLSLTSMRSQSSISREGHQ